MKMSDNVRPFVFYIMFVACALHVLVHYFSAIRNNQRFLYIMVPGFSLISMAFLLLAISPAEGRAEIRSVSILGLFAVGGIMWVISGLLYLFRFVGVAK